MTEYPHTKYTYGVELEFSDVRVGNPLPTGAQWNTKDNTIVNSNGIANDPLGKLWEFGGEINTKPTSTTYAQVAHIEEIIGMLDPKPIINYRCNLHVHVRVPELHNDLDSCKKLLKYIALYGQEAFDLIETIPKPNPQQLTPERYAGAMKRYKRRHRSHQYQLPNTRYIAMMAAKTTQEFYEEHAPLKDGKRLWYFSPRAAINLRQMWEETNTIEFRHFPGTINSHEFYSCLSWCKHFLDNILNNETPLTPTELYESFHFPLVFPKFEPYNHDLEVMYQLTNFDSNTRTVVASRLAEFRETGKITT